MSKPILYTFGLSVWSAVPELAIPELGYGPDSIEIGVVNLVEGANFKPEFLKINPNATLPTLVANEQVYASTKDVVRYLISQAPRQPGKASALDFIELIHQDKYDPNFILLGARDDEEWNRQKDFALLWTGNRDRALREYASTAPEFSLFYEKKIAENGYLHSIYTTASKETKSQFYQLSISRWNNIVSFLSDELPKILPDAGFIGGSEPGEDDFHLGGWLARVVNVVGGTSVPEGIEFLHKELNQDVHPRLRSYWNNWISRPSWQHVYKTGLH